MNNHAVQSELRLTSTLLSIRQGAIWKQKKTKSRKLMTIDTMQTELSKALTGFSSPLRFMLIIAVEYASMVRLNTTPIMQITNRNSLSFMFQQILSLLQQILLVCIVTGIQYLQSQHATRSIVSCVSSGSFLTLDCSHSRRQCLCTCLRVPLHSQGDMNNAVSPSSLTRHILHSFVTKSASRGYRVIQDMCCFLCWTGGSG